VAIDWALLDAWCRRELGGRPARQLFAKGHIAEVVGLELDDGRRVVVKLRRFSERLHAVADVQRHLFSAGFPAPEPLAGPSELDWRIATAEAYVAAQALNGPSPPVVLSAELLAELVDRSPSPSRFPALRPPPPWLHWDHGGEGIWPQPDDLDVDLNAAAGSTWLDEWATAVRRALRRDESVEVIGHADWEAHNLGWRLDRPVVVYDWDSLAVRTEPTLAGAAATVFASTTGSQVAATVEQSEAFLDAYQHRRGDVWSTSTLERAWAAGLWLLLYNAKKETAGGGTGYLRHLEAEADQRRLRAGLS
jgi:hypothetical protein